MIEFTPVTILIPVYGAADKLTLCLDSLVRYAPKRARIYVLDDATPDNSVRESCRKIESAGISLEYVRSPENRGFVRTCNWGAGEFWQSDSDLLLLNSDTEITESAVEEMQAVLHLHEKHGAVTPRSNNATIYSVPPIGPLLSPQDSYEVWLEIRDKLPRYAIMPTAVGFCLLIKRVVYERFGLFDEAYSPGYNEENDFVCRINRYGYSALAANRAFVFHHESSSFGARRMELEEANRDRLLERYPEYERTVSEYAQFRLDPIDAFAALRLRHRPRILFDLFHLTAAHTGTSEFGLNLLRELSRLIEDEFELHVGISETETFFDNVLAGYRIYEDRPDNRMTFDLLFKPCQILSWHEFQRMNRLAPRIAWVLQDIIGIRCEYLSSPIRRDLLEKAVVLSDCVLTISQSSNEDYAAYYGSEANLRVIHHGTNERLVNGLPREGEYILLMGNAYSHKGIANALEYLDERYPIVIVGGSPIHGCKQNVRWLRSGEVSHLEMREIVAGARLLVYPSYYEGFGLPIIDALALGKPVIALESKVNAEVNTMLRNPSFCIVHSLTELKNTIANLWNHSTIRSAPNLRSWQNTAQEYLVVLTDLLMCDPNSVRMRLRWELAACVGLLADSKLSSV